MRLHNWVPDAGLRSVQCTKCRLEVDIRGSGDCLSAWVGWERVYNFLGDSKDEKWVREYVMQPGNYLKISCEVGDAVSDMVTVWQVQES